MPSLLANSLVREERARMVRSFVVYELKQRACKVGTLFCILSGLIAVAFAR
jgi:hypothetical protein